MWSLKKVVIVSSLPSLLCSEAGSVCVVVVVGNISVGSRDHGISGCLQTLCSDDIAEGVGYVRGMMEVETPFRYSRNLGRSWRVPKIHSVVL